MSNPVEEFKEKVRDALERRANVAVNQLGSIRFRGPSAATAGTDGAVVALPSFSVEEIALAHSIYQAEAQVLTEMIGEIDRIFRVYMGEPAAPRDVVKAARIEKQEQERKKVGAY